MDRAWRSCGDLARIVWAIAVGLGVIGDAYETVTDLGPEVARVVAGTSPNHGRALTTMASATA